MSSTIEQIKNKLSIAEVIGSYLKLEKAGSNFKSNCPFHNEKTPSFFVSPSRDSYYCFGCGRKGDILNFVQEFEGVDFMGSLKILADKAGVEIKDINPELRDKKQKLLDVLEETTKFFEGNLEKNKEALKYLKDRGIKKETIKNFRLGFALDDWRTLLTHLTKKGFKEEDIEKAGLIKKSKGKTYDRFRSRIIFPMADPSGRIVAFSGRIFGQEDDKMAKYLNSPETSVFNKSNILYGYDKAKMEMRRKDFCVLVEGHIDLVMAHQLGYRNAVGLSGTALTEGHLEKIMRLTKKVVMAFDSDSAGFRASRRGARIALSHGIDLKIASIPEGQDPADLIFKDPEEWKKVIRESKHIIDFYLLKLLAEDYDKRKLAMEIREEILPFVVMVENKIDQALFVKKLSEVMELPQEAILEELEKIEVANDEPLPKEKKEEFFGRRENIVRRIMGILIWQEDVKDSQINIEKRKKDFIDIVGQEDIFDSLTKEEKEGAVFEADISYEGSSKLNEELDELLLSLKSDYIKEEFTKNMKKLKEAESKKDSALSMKILEKCQDLSKELVELKIQMHLDRK